MHTTYLELDGICLSATSFCGDYCGMSCPLEAIELNINHTTGLEHSAEITQIARHENTWYQTFTGKIY